MNALSSSTSNFLQLAERRLFVDKSSAIQEFLENEWPVHLLLRPRRSGKTTLLRMFQAFFQRGNPADLNQRKQLFLDNGLAITNNEGCMRQFGVFPVLYVDFSIMGTTFENLQVEFRNLLAAVARDLQKRGLLTNLDKLEDFERTFLTRVMNRTLPVEECRGALQKLTEILHTIHKRGVIVLIDDYDTPMANATRYGYFPQANEFFSAVFRPLLKDNEYLEGALIVGITQVMKADWFSRVNIQTYSLDKPGRYSRACMFTEAETRWLYEEQKTRDPTIPFTFEDLSHWYNGYTSGDGERLYNPWSIAMAFEGRRLDRYWADLGCNQAILARFHALLNHNQKFRKQIDRLLTDEPVIIEVDRGMTYHSVPEMSRIQLWTLLYSAGYLTRRMVESNHLPDVTGSDADNGSDSGNSSDSSDTGSPDADSDDSGGPRSGDLKGRLSTRIPNHEIRSLFRQWLRDHLMDSVNRLGKEAASIQIFRSMVSGSMAMFAKKFSKMIWTSQASSPFLGSREYVYQAFVYAFFTVAGELANSTKGAWTFVVEGYSGLGCFDFSQHRGREAVIQGYKRIAMSKKDKREGYGDSQRARLTQEAEEGLQQIATKGYRARLPDKVTKLREYGVAFLGAYCAIVGHSLERAPGGQWSVIESYCAERNERHRDKLYTTSERA